MIGIVLLIFQEAAIFPKSMSLFSNNCLPHDAKKRPKWHKITGLESGMRKLLCVCVCVLRVFRTARKREAPVHRTHKVKLFKLNE